MRLILCAIMYILVLYGVAYAESKPMPAQLALIVCKVEFVGTPTENDRYTGHRETKWNTEGGVMHCRRHAIDLYSETDSTFSQFDCNFAGVRLGAGFDRANADSPWRFFKFACPVPTIDTNTGEILAWTLPECGSLPGTSSAPGDDRGLIECEGDTPI